MISGIGKFFFVNTSNADSDPQLKAEVIEPFASLAGSLDSAIKPATGEGQAEKAAGMRKLLEARDCFIRAQTGRPTR